MFREQVANVNSAVRHRPTLSGFCTSVVQNSDRFAGLMGLPFVRLPRFVCTGRLATRHNGDDVCMAVHRRWRLNARRDLAGLRDELRQELVTAGLSPLVVPDLLLVMSELATNGLQAAGSRPAVTVLLTIDDEGDAVELLIKNVGVAFEREVADSDGYEMPPSTSPAGRGLAVAAALSDELEITPLIGGTQVRAARRRIR
ncbi:MAG: ATP-binding protein [Acidimicrobiia bacterium]